MISPFSTRNPNQFIYQSNPFFWSSVLVLTIKRIFGVIYTRLQYASARYHEQEHTEDLVFARRSLCSSTWTSWSKISAQSIQSLSIRRTYKFGDPRFAGYANTEGTSTNPNPNPSPNKKQSIGFRKEVWHDTLPPPSNLTSHSNIIISACPHIDRDPSSGDVRH